MQIWCNVFHVSVIRMLDGISKFSIRPPNRCLLCLFSCGLNTEFLVWTKPCMVRKTVLRVHVRFVSTREKKLSRQIKLKLLIERTEFTYNESIELKYSIIDFIRKFTGILSTLKSFNSNHTSYILHFFICFVFKILQHKSKFGLNSTQRNSKEWSMHEFTPKPHSKWNATIAFIREHWMKLQWIKKIPWIKYCANEFTL